MSKKEKLQKAKEKEMQKELQEKQFYDFANSRLCDLVKESTPRNDMYPESWTHIYLN